MSADPFGYSDEQAKKDNAQAIDKLNAYYGRRPDYGSLNFFGVMDLLRFEARPRVPKEITPADRAMLAGCGIAWEAPA